MHAFCANKNKKMLKLFNQATFCLNILSCKKNINQEVLMKILNAIGRQIHWIIYIAVMSALIALYALYN